MKDADFIHRLRKQGELAMATLSIITSSRRWEEQGYLRTIWRNWMHFLRFYLLMRNDAVGDVRETSRND